MVAKTHLWISAWFALVVPVVMWDMGYWSVACAVWKNKVADLCTQFHAVRFVPGDVHIPAHSVCSPRSMKGGDLHWIWKPYALYQEVDYVRPSASWACIH
jgi:hypothetical protein